jgi:hypothetical protein
VCKRRVTLDLFDLRDPMLWSNTMNAPHTFSTGSGRWSERSTTTRLHYQSTLRPEIGMSITNYPRCLLLSCLGRGQDNIIRVHGVGGDYTNQSPDVELPSKRSTIKSQTIHKTDPDTHNI